MTADGIRSSSWGGPLNESDYSKLLKESWISREIADQAMLRRVVGDEARQIVGRKGSFDCDGMLFPYIWPGEYSPNSYRIRRDRPDLKQDKDGNLHPDKKYLGAPGAGNRLFIPPGVSLEQLQDVSVLIVIVEGEKKSLALQRLAYYEIPKTRFVPIALPGVWNWRGVTGKAGGPNGERLKIKGPIPDLDRIQWAKREVIILFDRNVHTNDSVKWARSGIARELANRQAEVKFVSLPEDCGANGVDDLLALWGPARVLQLFDVPSPGTSLEIVLPQQYEMRPEGMVRISIQGSKLTRRPLTNYRAKIARSFLLDDGTEETQREFEIECEILNRSSRFAVSASAFAAMDWPIEKMGPAAITQPGQKDHARTAIQSCSLGAEEHRVYTHTGWRTIDGRSVFLHRGGALGADGAEEGINVRLPRVIEHYELVDPASPEDLQRAIRSSLRFIDPAISLPLRAATFRSVFGEADFSIHLAGETGAFKSELAALEQQFFGSHMDRLHLPGSWSSTANSLEMLAFHGKDVLTVIDDFAPSGSAADVARYHSIPERVFRAAGNHAGRGRLDSAARLREPKAPRGLILSTGEEIPRGHSIRARLLILEIAKGMINPAKLAECQAFGRSGLHVLAMSGFIRWLAPQFQEVREQLKRKTPEIRAAAAQNVGHARTPDIIANLQSAFEIYLQYAEEAGAVDSSTRARLGGECRGALCAVARAQAKHHAVSEPAGMFVSFLRSCLSSGEAHLDSRDGVEPECPAACGWRRDGDWRPQGRCVGWIDAEDIYLEPLSAYQVVQIAARNAGEALSITPTTLNKRLDGRKLLASTDTSRGTLTIRRTVGGSTKNVLHLRRSTLLPDEDGE